MPAGAEFAERALALAAALLPAEAEEAPWREQAGAAQGPVLCVAEPWARFPSI